MVKITQDCLHSAHDKRTTRRLSGRGHSQLISTYNFPYSNAYYLILDSGRSEISGWGLTFSEENVGDHVECVVQTRHTPKSQTAVLLLIVTSGLCKSQAEQQIPDDPQCLAGCIILSRSVYHRRPLPTSNRYVHLPTTRPCASFGPQLTRCIGVHHCA